MIENILVIGSKGFIGSHVFSYFTSKPKIKCWACDVSVDYTDDNYYQIDATNADYKDVFKGQQFDVCINCSGAASVPDSFKHPFRDFSLNSLNVVKMLEAIKEFQPECKFINLSSAAVYGNPSKLPVTEGAPRLPLSPYGLHKKYAEEIVEEYSRFFNIQTCSLRLFSVYGPRLKKQLLWDIFQKSLLMDEVKLFGTGNETRDFIYVDDIVAAIDVVMKNGNFNSGVYNVASGKAVSVDKISRQLLFELNYSGKISYSGTERVGDPIHWQADISSLRALGFEPVYSIEKGINKFAAWLKGLEL